MTDRNVDAVIKNYFDKILLELKDCARDFMKNAIIEKFPKTFNGLVKIEYQIYISFCKIQKILCFWYDKGYVEISGVWSSEGLEIIEESDTTGGKSKDIDFIEIYKYIIKSIPPETEKLFIMNSIKTNI